jgi:hypothetical protein
MMMTSIFTQMRDNSLHLSQSKRPPMTIIPSELKQQLEYNYCPSMIFFVEDWFVIRHGMQKDMDAVVAAAAAAV